MNERQSEPVLLGGYAAKQCPVRIAIVTARNSPAHQRVIHTLRTWNVTVDEAFFLGGLKIGRAHV